MAESRDTIDTKEAETAKQKLMSNPRFNDLLRMFEGEKKEKPKANFERPQRFRRDDNDINTQRGKNMKEKINSLRNDILYNTTSIKKIKTRNETVEKVVYEKIETKNNNNYNEFKKYIILI
jgi:hypothetical protein